MDLTEYQDKFNQASVKYKRRVKTSILSIPLIAGATGTAIYCLPDLTDLMDLVSRVGPGLFALGLISLVPGDKPAPSDFLPQVKLNDVVIYNPIIRVKGKDYFALQYNISKEHPILNQSIPKWKVVSIGQTTLVIQKDAEFKELPFSHQKYLTVQNSADALCLLNGEPESDTLRQEINEEALDLL